VSGVLHRLRSRPWWALVMACAGLALRTAIPVGFMPASAGQGTATLIVCPGHAPLPPTPDAGESQDEQPAPCPFSFAAGAALQFKFPALVSSPMQERTAVAAIPAAPRRRQALRSHGARDPPAVATV
jgi:hypothetical protein